ncbi:MAG: CTP synthase [Patescibacteria group bacterium]
MDTPNAQKHPKRKNPKYVFVIGGVMSGVGKGIATSSIGTLLQAKGFSVNLMKVDPYLNVDAGTMNPTEHGEVFVLDSGLETDQDMGNYERFLNRSMTHDDYLTSGMVYKHVIEKERNLGYRGRCVEAIPDIRDEIVHRFRRAAEKSGAEVLVVEIGGTVGDYQNIMFIEAARVLKIRHPEDVAFVMVSYLPIPSKLGEMKSRPTQNAIRQLQSYGVQTDIIIGRSEVAIDKKRKEKIAISCNVPAENVISAPDIESIYDVPINFERDKLSKVLLKVLHARPKVKEDGLSKWRAFVHSIKAAKDGDGAGKTGGNSGANVVNIAIVGKYFNTGDFVLTDSYVSILEAIKYSAYKLGLKPVIHTVNALDFEKKKPNFKVLQKFDGILVPGGFGETGIEGKLAVIRYAREQGIPYFGICYGMQLMVIEYARNVLGWKDANTAEINPAASKVVIDIMPDQKKKLAEGQYGASMRLGAYPAHLVKGTIAHEAYGAEVISERHRHRYEVNPAYIADIVSSVAVSRGKGHAPLVFSGTSPDGRLMEIAELPRAAHPFFLGTQFHPEFLARPLAPHPLFTEFLKAAGKRRGR